MLYFLFYNVRINSALLGMYLLSYVLVIIVGHFFVRLVLKKYPIKDMGLKNAGAAIGILERIFTLTFILIGEYTAIALIFTAKSITRFDQLKERKFAEYYLIGTLSSILFAMLIGIFAKWLLDNVFGKVLLPI